MERTKKTSLGIVLILSLLTLAGVVIVWLVTRDGEVEPPPPHGDVPSVVERRVPDLTDAPEGPEGDAIRRGHEIVTRTHEVLPDKARNGLHCTSCHLEGGTKPGAAPWIGLLAVFPEYRARSGREDTIQNRINDCFERSMNGEALDPEGEDMAAILAYMAFISKDVPSGETPGRGFPRIDPPRTPNREEGKALYALHCAACHGERGEGRTNEGAYLFPPLAGPDSFNIGAGMARLDTAAAFVHANMPLERGNTLTEEESYSIADYFIHLDRPDFPGKENDWPLGGKPRDARY